MNGARGPSADVPVALPLLGEEEAAAAREAILSGWVTQGPRVAAFEQAFADYVGAPQAVAVNSCTAALHLVLHALGVGPGDQVVVPSMSYIATANAVRHCGAEPVFAEVDPVWFNLDPADAARRITQRTRAVVLVHQIGNPADLAAFEDLCAARGLALVEDAACAVGSEHLGRRIGGYGHPCCFSFHPRKVITTGDGGMVTCTEPALAARLRSLRCHGMDVDPHSRHEAGKVVIDRHLELGWNYRMTDIQAAVGRVQLGRLPAILEARRALAARYTAAIQSSPRLSACLLPHLDPPGCKANFQSYAPRLRPECPIERNALMQALLDRGVHTRRGIMCAHLEPPYLAGGEPAVSLPVSEQASERSLLLPLYPQMDHAAQDLVLAALEEVLA